MNYDLTYDAIRFLAYDLALKNNLTVADAWNKNKMASIDWLKGFMSRHKDLFLRRPDQCSLGRSIACNKTNVGYFFEKLKFLYEQCESFSNGSRVYNLDETSTLTVQKQQKVIAQKGVKQLAQAASGERGTLVTCCIINAHGTFL